MVSKGGSLPCLVDHCIDRNHISATDVHKWFCQASTDRTTWPVLALNQLHNVTEGVFSITFILLMLNNQLFKNSGGFYYMRVMKTNGSLFVLIEKHR